MESILTTLRKLLQGEPLRAITYGAALVVWLVAGIAQLIGVTTIPPVDLVTALLAATAAATTIGEFARRFVYSTASAAEIVAGTTTATAPARADAILANSPPVKPPEEVTAAAGVAPPPG